MSRLFAVRHGETEWTLAGRHTSTTDIPLTERGRELSRRLKPVMSRRSFALALSSPMLRARDTCALSGFVDRTSIDLDLLEWNYGRYEGLTSTEIQTIAPGWIIFRDGCPGGESPDQVGARVDRIIARVRAVEGDTVIFGHGHFLRMLASRWLGLPPLGGQHFLLDTGTLGVLAFYRGSPAIAMWNAPLVEAFGMVEQSKEKDR